MAFRIGAQGEGQVPVIDIAACLNALSSASELSPSFPIGDEEGPEVNQQLGGPSVCTGKICFMVKCFTVFL